MTLGQQAGDGGDTGLSVLLVEDEFIIALLLEEMLRDLGYRVLGPVARLGKALEMARREGVDAAILDINLNGEEVYPVAETLAARGIPFVFVTGYGRDRLRAPYCNSPTLPKPFRRGDLQDALAMARAKQQN